MSFFLAHYSQNKKPATSKPAESVTSLRDSLATSLPDRSDRTRLDSNDLTQLMTEIIKERLKLNHEHVQSRAGRERETTVRDVFVLTF